MRDEETGDWITCSGGAFNFRDVRRELAARGLKFRSESRAEVMLKGFSARGRDAITDWRGMFALGFWNARSRSLTLVRDRLGVKPLYYYHDGDTLIFASGVRALLATGLIPRKISPPALNSYLALGSVEQPLTIIENVYALLPGHILEFKDGRAGVEAYWELRADKQNKVHDVRELIEELGELLADSVKSSLVSDVPVGVLLSGGINSSSVMALASRGAKIPVKSFSVCFNEQEFGGVDFAEKIAKAYGADHHSLLATEHEILSNLPEALRAMDQPSIEGLNTFIVSQAAAGAGMKVALSGLGGDEVFAGHDFYHSVSREEQMRNRVRSAGPRLRKAAASAIGAFSTIDRAARLSALLRSDQLNEHSVRLRRSLFTAGQRLALMLAGAGESPAVQKWNERQMANCATADPINQALALELSGYLSNAPLRATDSMSMAHGLEVRVPLIDHKVVERILAIPGRLKLRRREPNWMLMDAIGDLPREVVGAAKGWSEPPFKDWLAGAMRDRIESALWSPQLTKLLSITAMQEVWSDFLKGRASWPRVWSFYVLGEWAGINL
jgi:asparagine synthase (glutamine-hydrolysing)